MSTETIGYSHTELPKMPELRQKYTEAKIMPRLNEKYRRLNMLSDSQLDFFASVLN